MKMKLMLVASFVILFAGGVMTIVGLNQSNLVPIIGVVLLASGFILVLAVTFARAGHRWLTKKD